jgi:hypothetical protein
MVGAVNRVSFDYSSIEKVDSLSSISPGSGYATSGYEFQNTVSNLGATASASGSTGDSEYDVDFDYDPYANESSEPRPLQIS